ncbi:MAG: sulfurtransferase [Bacteroidetes bacterium]|nr:sulfurtransferase [Bacteroidota bacterium]MBU1483554.1 sulfurtransferase [Bacteroidota bacterium]MBU2045424.1 sulfurtransferase [Bacteroidota bacterium]MBU2268268.1 sulfurtransferase [Bacteroidota bacterium]MBU2375877.1 sulfurtransferase [Bacteroidota bacterium]
MISPIIQAADLLNLYPSENLIILDVSNGKNAKSNYEKQHLDDAVFVDLNTDLADIKDDFALGGRHPLPDLIAFSKTLSNLGISKSSHVILYDESNGSNAAARFWWMLKSVGHEKVQLLNGGIKEAEKVNFPINDKVEIPKKVEPYIITGWKLKTASISEVEKVSESDDHIVIDVRDAARYNGETEPIDLVAGHIPGAINIPFTENLDDEGLFLSQEKLKAKYEKALGAIKPENVIVHCGSGVTACHTLLALDYAGFEIPKLYVGSWSEWSRNGKKMITKDV